MAGQRMSGNSAGHAATRTHRVPFECVPAHPCSGRRLQQAASTAPPAYPADPRRALRWVGGLKPGSPPCRQTSGEPPHACCCCCCCCCLPYSNSAPAGTVDGGKTVDCPPLNAARHVEHPKPRANITRQCPLLLAGGGSCGALPSAASCRADRRARRSVLPWQTGSGNSAHRQPCHAYGKVEALPLQPAPAECQWAELSD